MTDTSAELERLIRDFRNGDRRSLARAISIVEDERTGSRPLLDTLLREPAGTAARVGITGPPGAGKSTLAVALARRLTDRDQTVGILAVDPTSPYSGGALLGDRIRLSDSALASEIFFRSMASRGASGGLGSTSRDVLDLMEAFGFDWLLVETVGAGQAETDVALVAETIVMVLVPESGDEIQALKAGLLEAADVLIVNKADREGAEAMAAHLRSMLELRTRGGGLLGSEVEPWTPPIVLASARTGAGIDEVLDALARHRGYLGESGGLNERRRVRAVERVRDLVRRELKRRAAAITSVPRWVDEVGERILSGHETPYSIAEEVLEAIERGRTPIQPD